MTDARTTDYSKSHDKGIEAVVDLGFTREDAKAAIDAYLKAMGCTVGGFIRVSEIAERLHNEVEDLEKRLAEKA